MRTQETLNVFLGMGRPAWKEARATLQKILSGYYIFHPPSSLCARFDFSSLLQLILDYNP
jgi:hypothetical protein